MKRVIAVLSVAAAAVAGVTLTASAATLADPTGDVVVSDSTGGIEITYLGTDAMGADTYRNRNAEYVQFTNTGTDPVPILNYKVEDAWAHADVDSSCNSFTVTGNNVDTSLASGLPSGHSLRVYTGWGVARVSRFDPTLHLAFMNSRSWCGANGHYLNNQRETVYVVDANGKVADSASYDFEWGYDFKVA